MTKREIIAQYEQVNRKYEVLFMPSVKRALHTKTVQVIAALNEGGYSAAYKFLATDMTNPALARVVRRLYGVVGSRHARITYSRLLTEKGFGFNAAWTEFILKYLDQFLLEKITFEVNRTTRDALMRVIATAVASGWSVDKTVDTLKDWPFERFQAARIVRTEVNRAANVGNKAQAHTSQYQQMKEWVSAQDFRVRGRKPKDHANHWALNGTTVDEGDVFIDSVNGDRLEFPGDPKASAASTVNCRCQAVYTFKRDGDGNPVPKRRTTTVIFPGQQRKPVVVQPRRTTSVIMPGDIRRPQTITI